ncbi:MAG: hypothetical protein IJV36_00350 [Prevotella sp.]|nr:hypothetical protein [Prevotella sp.]
MNNPAMIAATIVGVFLVYIYFREKREEKEELEMERERMNHALEGEKENEEKELFKPETRSLAYKVLREIGCQPEETEEERIWFDYQSATFLMEAEDECLFVNLILPGVHRFSVFDIDEHSRVRKIINEMNWKSPFQVFYLQNEKADEVVVHIKKNFILAPQIPQLNNYLKCILRDFFVTRDKMVLEIEKKRLQECEKA